MRLQRIDFQVWHGQRWEFRGLLHLFRVHSEGGKRRIGMGFHIQHRVGGTFAQVKHLLQLG